MSYMSGSVTPSTSKLLLKMRKLLGGKAQICYAGGPCFLNNFHSRKTYAARQADFAQTNGFKAFSGIRQKNPLIQSQYPANFWFFPANRADIPAECRQSDSSPPSLSPVTHRDRPCAGFKARLGKDVPWSGYLGSLDRCVTEAFLSKFADIARVEKCAG